MENDVIVMKEPDSVAAEAYRTLRTNITMREFDGDIKMINIVSSSAQEAKTTTAVNLAACYAQLGKKVLLIDLDLRLPTVHKKLGIKNKSGITDILSNNREEKNVIVNYSKNFDVLLSGSKTPFTAEFVQSEALKEYLKKLRNAYDIVIVDCPPVNLVTDGLITSTYCDGTLLCVAYGSDERRDLERARDSLESIGAKVLGVVMTRMPEAKGYYKDKYAYRYAYGHEKNEEKKNGWFSH